MITRDQLNEKISLRALEDIKSVDDVKLYGFSTSSGTSSGTPIFVAAHKQERQVCEYFGNMRRPCLLFGSPTGLLKYISSIFLYLDVNQALTLDVSDLTLDLGSIFQDYRPDGFFGSPSFIVSALEGVHDTSTLAGIKKIYLMGEMITTFQESFLQKKIPNTVVKSTYGLAELGPLTLQVCTSQDRNLQHPFDGITIESIDVDEEGIGELAVSCHISPSVVIKDYRTGDLARLLPGERCICGRSPIFKLMGRKDYDFIRLAGITLRSEEFDRVTHELQAYIGDYRATVGEKRTSSGIKIEIKVGVIPTRLCTKKDISPSLLAELLSKKLFVTARHTLGYMVSQSIFLPPVVTFVTSFPQQNKVVKLRRIKETE